GNASPIQRDAMGSLLLRVWVPGRADHAAAGRGRHLHRGGGGGHAYQQRGKELCTEPEELSLRRAYFARDLDPPRSQAHLPQVATGRSGWGSRGRKTGGFVPPQRLNLLPPAGRSASLKETWIDLGSWRAQLIATTKKSAKGESVCSRTPRPWRP